MKKAIGNVKNPDAKLRRLLAAGDLHELELRGKTIVVQIRGISLSDAKDIILRSTVRGLIPEPIRVAHIIASGITKGDSKGRA